MCIELEIPQALHGELQQCTHHSSIDFNKNSMHQYYQTTSRAIHHGNSNNTVSTTVLWSSMVPTFSVDMHHFLISDI